nr:unnamed protein product [Callosobruchus chinensis]
MPYKYIGRVTDYKGKTLWEILGNLKNNGVGRIVARNKFECYYKILKVETLANPQEPSVDSLRKVRALVEKTFRGKTFPKPVLLESSTYKTDYILIPKDEEEKYCKKPVSSVAEHILPRTMEFPPLLKELLIREAEARGQKIEEPKLEVAYNRRSIKTSYRVAKEGETPTVEIAVGLGKPVSPNLCLRLHSTELIILTIFPFSSDLEQTNCSKKDSGLHESLLGQKKARHSRSPRILEEMHLSALLAAVLLVQCTNAQENGWSWNNNQKSESNSAPSNAQTSENQQFDLFEAMPSDHLETAVQLNSTEAEKVVDEILTSTREGRALDGLDELYTDPNVQEALQNGDDGQARNVIKDRLCYLGLVQCDGGEQIEGKRPFIGPEELVYAQPVAINPVGRPIPTIPIKGVRGGYGPAKPVHIPGPPGKYGPPPPNKFVPPPPPGYPGKPPRRHYGPPPSKPFYGKPGLSGEIYEGGEYLSKPPASFGGFSATSESPYQFVTASNKDKRVEITVNAQGGAVTAPGGAPSANGAVEHVHHHFHHNVDGKPTVAAVTAGLTSLGSPTTFGKPVSSGFSPLVPETIIGPISGSFGGSYGGQHIANYGSSLGVNSFGAIKPVTENFDSFGTSIGSYGSTSDLYKKELNLNPVNNNFIQSNYADKYQGLESSKYENFDCVCVPYNQCPTHDVIGRKDDLYLAIDPRNLKSDIEAEEERVITDENGNMTVVRIAKGASLNATEETDKKNEEPKKISKREAPAEKKSGEEEDKPEGVISKDDYGNKEIKPFVNLHVTPNNFLVHKLEDWLSYKKAVVFNKHKHYHIHKAPPYVASHHSHEVYDHHQHSKPVDYPEYVSHGPHFHHRPSHYGPEPIVHDSPYHQHGPYLDHEPSPHYEPEYPHSGPYDESDYESGPQSHDNYYHNALNYGGGDHYDTPYGRAIRNDTDYVDGNSLLQQYQEQYDNGLQNYGNDKNVDSTSNHRGGKSLNYDSPPPSNPVKFPSSRKRRDVSDDLTIQKLTKRQFYGGNGFNSGRPQTCGPRHVCCKRPTRPAVPQVNRQCGTRHSQGINGRIKNPVYIDGDSEFGEYPWQVAILKKDPKESVYVCGGTLIDSLHIITAAHCVKTYHGFDLRVRLGEWDVNHDVEFFPYIEREVTSVHVHPEFYAGTLYNDIAVLRIDKPVDFAKNPHISPACLPHPRDDYTGTRCWTTGWGKDAFGDFGKYQNILKEVDVPVLNDGVCQRQMQQTRLGYDFKLHPGFICAGGEEGKDACKGDGGGPMVCERGGTWQVVGIVSWGIGCGQVGVPGVYVKVAHYLDWIKQITQIY